MLPAPASAQAGGTPVSGKPTALSWNKEAKTTTVGNGCDLTAWAGFTTIPSLEQTDDKSFKGAAL